MKSLNVGFGPKKLCTMNNSVELGFQHSSREVGHNNEDDHVSEEKEDLAETSDVRPGTVQKSGDIPEVKICALFVAFVSQ